MARRPDPRRVKIHRSYTIAEVASLFQIHRNTVRRWAKQGLQVLDERKPYLILGRALASFLADRNSRRIRLKPGEMYCVKCKVARRPAHNIADYVPITAISGNLRGLCPHCATLMHRRSAHRSIAINAPDLQITVVEGSRRIADRQSHSSNDHFDKETHSYDKSLSHE
jgi:hypothetical protein